MRLAAVSIDLDEIPHYHAIHGLPAPSAASATLVYDCALSRARSWAESLGIPLTLFVIGRDLEREQSVRELRAHVDRRDEIANHSLDHRYDLTRLNADEMRHQIVGGIAAIERALGVHPVGFRSPGYTTSDALLDIVKSAGADYDASVFPCASYFLAKQAVLGMMSLSSRESDSISGDARHLFAPIEPYRLGRPYWSPGHGLREIPVQVTRGPRLPFIGTAITMAPRIVIEGLLRGVVGLDCVNLELHGIDFLDERDGLATLSKSQPDIRVEARKKLENLSLVIRRLHEASYRFVRHDELARAALP